MRKNGSNTADKQPKGKKVMPEGEPFKKGYDPRRNMKGRPKAFDQWRALAQDIGAQIATKKDGDPLLWNGQEITVAELILLSWAGDKKTMKEFAEVAYGKVPTQLNLEIKDEMTDDERIARLTALLDAARTRRVGQPPE